MFNTISSVVQKSRPTIHFVVLRKWFRAICHDKYWEDHGRDGVLYPPLHSHPYTMLYNKIRG